VQWNWSKAREDKLTDLYFESKREALCVGLQEPGEFLADLKQAFLVASVAFVGHPSRLKAWKLAQAIAALQGANDEIASHEG